MDDKIYDLLEKVYIELQDTKKEVTGIKDELQDTKKEVEGVKVDSQKRIQGLRDELLDIKREVKENSNHIIRLENVFHDKIGALSDEMAIVRGDIEGIKNKLDVIEEKVDRNDIRIKVIEGGRRKKSI